MGTKVDHAQSKFVKQLNIAYSLVRHTAAADLPRGPGRLQRTNRFVEAGFAVCAHASADPLAPLRDDRVLRRAQISEPCGAGLGSTALPPIREPKTENLDDTKLQRHGGELQDQIVTVEERLQQLEERHASEDRHVKDRRALD